MKDKKIIPMMVNIHSFGDGLISKANDKDPKLGVDPFSNYYQSDGSSKILAPPYDLYQLSKMPEASDILGQCIRAMVVNIEGFGWELKRVDDPTNATPLPPEAEVERKELELFLNYINDKDDIVELRKKVRADLESTGLGYIEVIRNRGGKIAELYWIPSHSMRITSPDKTNTEYVQRVRSSEGKFVEIQRNRRFCRYVQNTVDNNKVYFKEFGDPRIIGSKDGKVNGMGIPAHEVICLKLFVPYSVYGLPRWLGNLVTIMGSRKAEEVNYLFFDNKSIPPLIVTVSGGALTEETLEKLETLFNKELKGVENFHRMLLLEATPHSASDIPGEKITPVRIEVKPLTEYIQKDGLFIEYRKNARSDVRSSFNLPPIYTGDTVDYTRATAFESARVAEEQVFEPERKQFDYIFNRTVLTDMGINYWKLHSLGAKTSDDVAMTKAVGMVKEAIPVGVIQEMVADMRNVPLGNIPDELYTTTLEELRSSLNPTNQNNQPMDSQTVDRVAEEVSKILKADVNVLAND